MAHTATEIAETFAAAGREMTAERAAALAGYIASWDSFDTARRAVTFQGIGTAQIKTDMVGYLVAQGRGFGRAGGGVSASAYWASGGDVIARGGIVLSDEMSRSLIAIYGDEFLAAHTAGDTAQADAALALGADLIRARLAAHMWRKCSAVRS